MPAVPPAFATLAFSRGKGSPGSVPSATKIIFSIGGELYSEKPWAWLSSQSAAEDMAVEVAKWPQKYGCDGIDLDIETGAGTKAASINLVAFVARLKQLNPTILLTQPGFGSPTSVPAANAVIAASFNHSFPGSQPAAFGALAHVGIMVYSGTSSLQYVSNYADGCQPSKCSQYYCPLAACVPRDIILPGISGGADAATIVALAHNATTLGGVMIWYTSALDQATGHAALTYDAQSDANDPSHTHTQDTWQAAQQILNPNAAAVLKY